jgi:hypothetical protein
MIDALIAGRLYGAPQERTTKAGKPFARAKLRVVCGNGSAQFVSVVAFVESAVTALLALSDGDSAALAGNLTAGAFVDKGGAARPSLDLVAQQVLTEYHVQRRRKAVREEICEPQLAATTPFTQEQEFDDALPF